MTPEKRPEPRNPFRFLAFALVIVVAVSALGARMFYLQIMQGKQAEAAISQPQQTAIVPVESNRGLIYDRNGNILAENVVSYSVKIVPKDLPFSERPRVIGRLADLLHLDPADITTQLDSTNASLFDPVRVARDVPVEVARVIQEDPDALPGVQVVAESRRDYVGGPLYSHILGYTGPVDADEYEQLKSQGYLADDMIGKAGVESTYEKQLRGTYGSEEVALDSTGRPIPGMATPITPAVGGSSLRLTIDMHEQELAYKALNWAVQGVKGTKGVIIVENPQNGEILAMVSLPNYDDNLFAKGISPKDFQALATDPDKPLINRAISDQYPPGSTFKLVTGTAGLADKRITDKDTILTKAYVQLGAVKFWDWNKRGWGPLTIYNGFGESSDTFFYQLATKVGLPRETYWANQYGFGSPTGIDLPGEVAGIIPSDAWKESTLGDHMYGGELMQMGIGQGYDTVTPLQLLNAYSTLANGGNVWEPRVVKDVLDSNGNVVKAFQPTLAHKMAAPADVLKIMRNAARRVVTIRHTFNLVNLPIKIAGKTGTAEFGSRDAYGRLPYHEWFVGFVPGDPYHGNFDTTDSQLAVVAFVYGANSAADVATEVVKYYFQLHFGIKKDYRLFWTLRRANFYGTSRPG